VFAAISDARDLLLHQEQLPAELLQVSSLPSYSFFTGILKLLINSVIQHHSAVVVIVKAEFCHVSSLGCGQL